MWSMEISWFWLQKGTKSYINNLFSIDSIISSQSLQLLNKSIPILRLVLLNISSHYNYFMQPDQQQAQQKGLFTFYRQQADLQDQLKLRRHFLKQAKEDRAEEDNEKKLFNNNHNKHFSPLNENSEEKKKQAHKKLMEPRDKLIGILRKYNGKQIKKRQNLRIILESQQQTHLENNTSNLKNRLERLLDDEQKSLERKLGIDEGINDSRSKLQYLSSKKQMMPRLNPFQKLAIIPTYFHSQFQIEVAREKFKKKSLSKQRSLANSIQFKKNDKIEANYRYQLKNIKEFADSKRVNLPRIEARTNSQVIDKRNKIRLQRLGQKSMIDQIQTERFSKKPQSSLFLESVKLTTECSTNKVGQNKIYSLFIQNHQQKNKEQMKSKHKEFILSDVLKRLKFS